MKYARLGRTGLQVSRVCLGCMSYGDPDAAIPGERMSWKWALREEESRPFFRRAIELGINFFDTANVYSFGVSEEITGRALKEYAKRDEVVIATKVHGVMRKGPNGRGLSRKHILHEIDGSLRRLGTDYVDLYQIHRWDDQTPIEETMEAMNDVVRAGKARYIGASSMWAWQLAKANHIAERHGWARFVSMQNHYNLLYREEEREMTGVCVDQGLGIIPWSPLARGRLARGAKAQEPTARAKTDVFGGMLYGKTEESDLEVLKAVDRVAGSKGVPSAQVALAWLLQARGVTAPIVGATKPQHLDDAVAALDVTLSPEDVKALEEKYVPHPVAGFV
jgi:aryl-alcohol dehydrogenase-like predicted oxidoreductase